MDTITLETVVNPDMKFKPDAIRSCKTLARTKPWQGDFATRFDNIAACLRSLCEAHGMEPIQLTHVGSKRGISAASRWRPDLRRIELTGRLSVVSMIQLFALARAAERRTPTVAHHLHAIRWSINLFKRTFPLSFSRCRLVAGLLINDGRRDDD
jgi:hypothetical protein